MSTLRTPVIDDGRMTPVPCDGGGFLLKDTPDSYKLSVDVEECCAVLTLRDTSHAVSGIDLTTSEATVAEIFDNLQQLTLNPAELACLATGAARDTGLVRGRSRLYSKSHYDELDIVMFRTRCSSNSKKLCDSRPGFCPVRHLTTFRSQPEIRKQVLRNAHEGTSLRRTAA